MCRQDIDLYSTTLVATGKPLLTPDVSTIFGCAFLQNGSVGVASYHFESPDECYISYEHAPEQWKLGDGSRPPPRKPFLNPKYGEATRTFTGTIEWEEGFNGDARWEYEMIFSRNLAWCCANAAASTLVHSRSFASYSAVLEAMHCSLIAAKQASPNHGWTEGREVMVFRGMCVSHKRARQPQKSSKIWLLSAGTN